MKTRILLTIFVALAAVVIASSANTAFADGGRDKGKKPPKHRSPEVVEQVLQSEPVFDDSGEFVGTAEIVVQEPPPDSNTRSSFTTSAVTRGYTRYRTCSVEFSLKNIYGQKVISYKLTQTFRYNGSRIVSWYGPITSSSTKWGWSGSDYRKGSYWLSRYYSARSWGSATFTLKLTWWTVQQYRPTIGIDGYGSGYCRPWGYW